MPQSKTKTDTPSGWEPVDDGTPTGWEPVDGGTVAQDFTANPKNEGLYQMMDKDSSVLHVPFSRVKDAQGYGLSLKPEDSSRFQKDYDASLSLPRTAGSYANEIAGGIARGLKNDVMGAYETIRHPIDTGIGLYKQTVGALGAADKEYRDEQVYDPKTKTYSHNIPKVGTALAFLENAPIVGGMIQHAERGGNAKVSPESVGAAAEGITTFAAPELAGKAVKGAGTSKFVSESVPKGLINQLIKPMASDVKFGKDPTAAVLREKLTGNSLEQLGDRVYDRLHDVGREIDAKAKGPSIANKVVDVSDALKPIDKAIQDATKSGNPALVKKLSDLRLELSQNWKVFKDAQGNVTIRPSGVKNLKMSPAEALEFKRQVADRIRWDGTDPFNNDLNAVKGEIFGKLKEDVNNAVPGLKELNNRYSDLVGAGKAIERRSTVAARNHAWSLSDIALGASGHVPLAIARKALNTPAVTTRVARALNDLGDKTTFPSKVIGKVPLAGSGIAATGAVQANPKELLHQADELQDQFKKSGLSR